MVAVQLRAGGRAIVSAESSSAVARHCGDDARRCDHFAHAIVARVRNVEIASGIHGNSQRDVQLCAGGRDIVAVIAAAAVARNRGDNPCIRHLADAFIAVVRDVQIVRRIHCDAARIAYLRAGGRAVVAAIAPRARARNSGDNARRRGHLADAMVRGVRDEHIAQSIHRDFIGVAHLRGGGRDVVAVIARRARARDRADQACRRRHLADAVVAAVCNIDVARPVDGNRLGRYRSAGGRDVVAVIARCACASHRTDEARRRRHFAHFVVV